MLFKFGVADAAGPKAGLTPAWYSLRDASTNADKSGSAPSISEIGDGCYKFELTYGTAPWDVAELVGWIDLGSEILDVQRYIFVSISVRDLGFAYLTNKRQQTIATGKIEVLEDDGVTVLFELTPTQAGGKEILTPSGPS